MDFNFKPLEEFQQNEHRSFNLKPLEDFQQLNDMSFPPIINKSESSIAVSHIGSTLPPKVDSLVGSSQLVMPSTPSFEIEHGKIKSEKVRSKKKVSKDLPKPVSLRARTEKTQDFIISSSDRDKTLYNSASDIVLYFEELTQVKSIQLESISMFYSMPTIHAKSNTFVMTEKDQVESTIIKIPHGQYNIQSLCEKISQVATQQSKVGATITMKPNRSHQLVIKSKIDGVKSPFQLYFNQPKLGKLLGFNYTQYGYYDEHEDEFGEKYQSSPKSTYVSEGIPTLGYDEVYLVSNSELRKGKMSNGSNYWGSLSLCNKPFGEQFTHEFKDNVLEFSQPVDLSQLTLKLVSQDNVLYNLCGTDYTIKCKIKFME